MATRAKKKKSGTGSKINSYVKPVDFKTMTAPQRRVAIAKDVIAGLAAKRLVATQGQYVTAVFNEEQCDLVADAKGEVDVQEVLAKNVKQCEVCAKGAMFIAAVEKFNRFKLSGIQGRFGLSSHLDGAASDCDYLGRYFRQETLDLIEEIFEDVPGAYIADEDELAKAAYSILYEDPTDRLVAIMENIIANDGEFVLSVKLA